MAQFENQIKPWMYVRRSAVLCMKKLHFVRKISSVACGFSCIKIHYSVNRINEVYVFLFNKISLKRYFIDKNKFHLFLMLLY